MKNNKIIMTIFLLSFIIICSSRIIYLSVFKHERYKVEYVNATKRIVSGPSAPRGKILDANGKILVDNIGVNAVVYNKSASINADEVDIARKLSSVLEIDINKSTTDKLKTFYLKCNDDGNSLITNEERRLYKERKLNKNDIDALKRERITDEMLNEMSHEDKESSYIYYLMTHGYSYEDKLIEKGITNEQVVKIEEMNLSGVKTELVWERTYPYGSTLRSILGGISTNGVPKEHKKLYVDKGISLNSTVGISGLEFEYDKYLRGTDAKYELDSKGKPKLLSKESSGADLYLSIDIDHQLKIEEILKSEMINAKKFPNTAYYNHSYMIVGDPNTGAIISAVGLQIIDDHFMDITSNIVMSSYTVGSIVKGATISVGYKNNLIEPGRRVRDSCIKVYGVTEKCSWKSLGNIDDISALALSSNYYQFLIATRLTNPNYKWNSKLNATKEHFNIYRSMLASYGLGTKTGVDFPNERTGIIGKTVSDDLILNLSIGQYDTYTPIEVFQYINTLASRGDKRTPKFMKEIKKGDKIIKKSDNTVIGKVDLNSEQMDRVQLGLRTVMKNGTGRNYASANINASGKTGTSETFVDSNGDGQMDTKTTSTAFIMYAPSDNPKYSIIILSPNISTGGYKYSLNLKVVRKVTDYLFSN